MADQIDVHSSLNLPPRYAPTGNPRPVRVRDVALVAIDHSPEDAIVPACGGVRPRVGACQTPQDRGFNLGQGVRLGRLGDDEAALISSACSPRGHHFWLARAESFRYAYWRDVTGTAINGRSAVLEWDPTHRLYTALVLSRWIRDNGAGLAGAARLVDYEDGQQQVIPVGPTGWRAYRLPSVDGDWLDDSDAGALRHLLDAYWDAEESLPPRVTRAIYRAEAACRMEMLDDYLAMLVVALEALLTTREHKLSEIFRRRLAALARVVGPTTIEPVIGKQIYRARSQHLHGKRVEDTDAWDELVVLTRLARDVLRATLRKTVEDQEFREVFAENARIDDWFGSR